MAVDDNSIITFDMYCRHAGLDKDNANLPRDQIEFAIDAVSDYLRQWLHRKVILATITEIFYGTNESVYWPRNGHVVSVTSIEYWNGTGWTEMTSTQYPRETDGASPDWDTFVRFKEGDKMSMNQRYRIIYTSGWARASVPFALQSVTAILVQRYMKNAEGREGMSSEAAGAASSVLTLDQMFDKRLREMATPYKVLV